MYKNIFFTGARRIGKSTALQTLLKEMKAAQKLPLCECGFYSCKKGGFLIVTPIGFPEQALTCAVFLNGNAAACKENFNNIGGFLAAHALKNPPDYFVFDECGRLESDAEVFKSFIISAVQSSIPVFGVLQKNETESWLQPFLKNELTKIITVTEENRNDKVFAKCVRDRNGWL